MRFSVAASTVAEAGKRYCSGRNCRLSSTPTTSVRGSQSGSTMLRAIGVGSPARRSRRYPSSSASDANALAGSSWRVGIGAAPVGIGYGPIRRPPVASRVTQTFSLGRKVPSVKTVTTLVAASAGDCTVARGSDANSSSSARPLRYGGSTTRRRVSTWASSRLYRYSTAARSTAALGSVTGSPAGRKRIGSSGTKQTSVTPSTVDRTSNMRSTSQYCMVSARVLLWLVTTLVTTSVRSDADARRMLIRWALRRAVAERSTAACEDCVALEV